MNSPPRLVPKTAPGPPYTASPQVVGISAENNNHRNTFITTVKSTPEAITDILFTYMTTRGTQSPSPDCVNWISIQIEINVNRRSCLYIKVNVNGKKIMYIDIDVTL